MSATGPLLPGTFFAGSLPKNHAIFQTIMVFESLFIPNTYLTFFFSFYSLLLLYIFHLSNLSFFDVFIRFRKIIYRDPIAEIFVEEEKVLTPPKIIQNNQELVFKFKSCMHMYVKLFC